MVAAEARVLLTPWPETGIPEFDEEEAEGRPEEVAAEETATIEDTPPKPICVTAAEEPDMDITIVVIVLPPAVVTIVTQL